MVIVTLQVGSNGLKRKQRYKIVGLNYIINIILQNILQESGVECHIIKIVKIRKIKRVSTLESLAAIELMKGHYSHSIFWIHSKNLFTDFM